MRILILGLPRSGTSSLYDFLRTSLPKNYECKYEPFKTEYIENFKKENIERSQSFKSKRKKQIFYSLRI